MEKGGKATVIKILYREHRILWQFWLPKKNFVLHVHRSVCFNFSSGVTNLGNIQYLISAVCNRINRPIPTRENSLFTLSPWLIGPFPKKGVADDATAYRPETPQNRQLLQFTTATLSKIRSPSVVGSRWSIRRKRVIIDILSCCRRKPRRERARSHFLSVSNPVQKVKFSQFSWKSRQVLDSYPNAAFRDIAFWEPYVASCTTATLNILGDWVESGF